MGDAYPETPDPEPEDQEAARHDISRDIAEYLSRFDCHNIDPTVDPIDLLRRVDAMMEVYDSELEVKDRRIEQLEAGQNDELIVLRRQVAEATLLTAKVNQNPWIKTILDRIRTS